MAIESRSQGIDAVYNFEKMLKTDRDFRRAFWAADTDTKVSMIIDSTPFESEEEINAALDDLDLGKPGKVQYAAQFRWI